MMGGLVSKQRKQWLAKIVATALFIWAGWFLAIRPPLAKIQSFKHTTAEADERSQLILEIQSLTKKQKALESKFLDEDNRHTILGKVTTLANETGLNLKSATPSLQPDKHYSKLVLEVKAQAGFAALTKFLEQIEKTDPPLVVSDLNVSNQLSRYQQREITDVSMNLEAYLTKNTKSA